MACQITFQKHEVLLNNRQFSRLIQLAVEVAMRDKSPEAQPFIQRMQTMEVETFWPGRGIEVEEDFPQVEERRFWCRVFFDTARAIFDRTAGWHEHAFWQTQAIHQAYSTGLLFEAAVRDTDSDWSADTQDRREFHRIVNADRHPPAPREE